MFRHMKNTLIRGKEEVSNTAESGVKVGLRACLGLKLSFRKFSKENPHLIAASFTVSFGYIRNSNHVFMDKKGYSICKMTQFEVPYFRCNEDFKLKFSANLLIIGTVDYRVWWMYYKGEF